MHVRFLRILPAALAVALGLAVLLWPDPALAQVGDALDAVVRSLEEVFRRSADTLSVWARQFLLSLLVLDLVWRGGKWMISGQSFADVAEQMVYTIGIVGLAWGFTTLGPDIVNWITRQATILSNAAVPGSGSALTPSGILGSGLRRAFGWVEAASIIDPRSWALLVCAFIALVMMAAELAMVILVYAEMHLVGLVGIVTLGFAGLSQTRGIATRYVMSMIGKGFKLMTLLLVADVAHSLAEVSIEVLDAAAPTGLEIDRLRNQHGSGGQDEPVSSVSVAGAMSAILLQMIGVALMLTLPGAVERLVAGSSVGDVAGTGAKMVAGTAASGLAAAGGAALGAAGGAAPGALKAAREVGAGAITGGVNWKAVAESGKAAARGAAQGGVNWGQVASERGGIGKELGSRLRDRVNRPAAGSPGDGSQGGPGAS